VNLLFLNFILNMFHQVQSFRLCLAINNTKKKNINKVRCEFNVCIKRVLRRRVLMERKEMKLGLNKEDNRGSLAPR
jgi:hypothetical protein